MLEIEGKNMEDTIVLKMQEIKALCSIERLEELSKLYKIEIEVIQKIKYLL